MMFFSRPAWNFNLNKMVKKTSPLTRLRSRARIIFIMRRAHCGQFWPILAQLCFSFSERNFFPLSDVKGAKHQWLLAERTSALWAAWTDIFNHNNSCLMWHWFNSLSFVEIKRCFSVKRSWCAPLHYVPWWPGILLKGGGQCQCNEITLLLTSLPFWFDLQVGFDLQICRGRLWPKHWLPSNRWNSKWGSLAHRAFPIERIVMVFQVTVSQ